MKGQMSWLSASGTDGEKILHLRMKPYEPWRPYTEFRQYAVPDLNEPGASKGWTTYQKLIQAGWQLIPSSQVRNPALVR
jgi:hypothetical protein